jgi:cold shock CspA family protein
MRGVLKTWTKRNNFGFIARPGEKDLFAHASEFVGERRVGAEFEYELGVGPNGNGRECAKQIRMVDG